MSLSKITRPLALLAMLTAVVLSGANRSHAGIVFSATTDNSLSAVFTDSQTAAKTIIGYDTNSHTTPLIDIQGFSSTNSSPIDLDSANGHAQIHATSGNLKILNLTAKAGLGISAMNWKLIGDPNNKDGTLIFNAYDLNDNLIGLTSGVNTFNWTSGLNQFNFQTDNGSLVSRLEIISSKDIAQLKQIDMGVQSVPEPTSTLAFAGVAAMCGLYRLRRRNRKTEK